MLVSCIDTRLKIRNERIVDTQGAIPFDFN